MRIEELESLSSKDRDMFKLVCNKLLTQTFIVNSEKKNPTKSNPEYLFITRNFDLIKDYLSYLDWDLHKEANYGYYFVTNLEGTNRHTFDKETTQILLVLRILFDDNSKNANLNHTVLCYVSDVLDQLISVFGLYKKKPNMKDFAHCMRALEMYNIIEKWDGNYTQNDCAFVIWPTIRTVVTEEKIATLVTELKQEDEDEETEKSTFD